MLIMMNLKSFWRVQKKEQVCIIHINVFRRCLFRECTSIINDKLWIICNNIWLAKIHLTFFKDIDFIGCPRFESFTKLGGDAICLMAVIIAFHAYYDASCPLFMQLLLQPGLYSLFERHANVTRAFAKFRVNFPHTSARQKIQLTYCIWWGLFWSEDW